MALLLLACSITQQARAECVQPDDILTSLALATPEVSEERRVGGWMELTDRLCVSVTWTGEVRELPEPARKFMDDWVNKVARNKTIRNMFRNQVRVREGDKDYWLVIQEPLLAAFRAEVGSDGPVTLQVKRFGAAPNSSYIFGIQEFVAGAGAIAAEKLRPVGVPMTQLEQTTDLLRDLLENHPSPDVRGELQRWIKEKTIAYSISADAITHQMSVILYAVDGKLSPVLVINPKWFLNSISGDEKRDRHYKELVLYHEYIHLRDHFRGEIKLLPLQLARADVEQNLAEYAQRFWRAEYSARKAEVAFALEQGWGDVLDAPWNRADVQQDERKFLDAFFDLMGKTDQNVSDEKLLPRFRSSWQEIFDAERQRLQR